MGCHKGPGEGGDTLPVGEAHTGDGILVAADRGPVIGLAP